MIEWILESPDDTFTYLLLSMFGNLILYKLCNSKKVMMLHDIASFH